MFFFFFFNDTATTEIYTLSLHDALPISGDGLPGTAVSAPQDDQPESRDVPAILCQRGASVRALGRAARRPRAAPRGSRRAGDRRRDLSQRLVRLRSGAASA